MHSTNLSGGLPRAIGGALVIASTALIVGLHFRPQAVCIGAIALTGLTFYWARQRYVAHEGGFDLAVIATLMAQLNLVSTMAVEFAMDIGGELPFITGLTLQVYLTKLPLSKLFEEITTHYGIILACMVIALIGGPLVTAIHFAGTCYFIQFGARYCAIVVSDLRDPKVKAP